MPEVATADATPSLMTDIETLDLMLQDLAEQSPLHQPTSFWRVASLAISDEFRANGLHRFRSLPKPLTFFVPTYGLPGNSLDADLLAELTKTHRKSVPAGSKQDLTLQQLFSGELHALGDYRTYLAGDDRTKPPVLDHCSESETGQPVEQFEFEGRRFSRSLLNYILALVFLKKHADTATLNNVLEVGGGFGSLGEILASDPDRSYTYVDIDIPPTAVAASYYLRQIHGDRLLEYPRSRQHESITLDGSFDAAVICPWQLPGLSGRFDLFVNSISFQEMEPPVVRFYLENVDRLQTRLVLLRNLREGKQKKTGPGSLGVEEPILGCDYDALLPNYELVAVGTVPFGYRTVDGFHSELRLYRRK